MLVGQSSTRAGHQTPGCSEDFFDADGLSVLLDVWAFDAYAMLPVDSLGVWVPLFRELWERLLV